MSEHQGIFTHDSTQAYLAAEPEMQTEQLSDRLWTVSDGHSRSIFVEGHQGVIAFDTFGTPGRARAYRSAVDQAMPGKTVGNLAGDAAFRGRNRWVFPGQQRDFEWGAFFRPLNRRDWVGIVHLSHATSTPHDVNGCIHVSRW